jgi:hypothetical protein
MSFWIRNRKKGTMTSFSFSPSAFMIILTVFLVVAVSMIRHRARSGSLVGAMYRTEANLVAIESAMRAYRNQYGALPPSGMEGLELAIDEQNRNVVFYPGGAPRDGWNRAYIYVNGNDYGSEDSLAVKDARSGLYHNPGGYQLYSLGADAGRSPEDGPMAGDRLNEDNINNWDSSSQWRGVYKRRAKRIPAVRGE